MNNRKYNDTFETVHFGNQVVWTTRFYIRGLGPSHLELNLELLVGGGRVGKLHP